MTEPIQAHVDRVVMESGKDIVLTLVCSRRFRDECVEMNGRMMYLCSGDALIKTPEAYDGQ